MSRIIEVGEKDVTERDAIAEATVTMTPQACGRVVAGTAKGDVLEAARIAGLLGAKRTADLLPFCHPVAITGAEVDVESEPGEGRIHVRATVRATDRTGVEMEALTACSVAALTLYDAAKAFDRGTVIGPIRLVEKHGGRSGSYRVAGETA